MTSPLTLRHCILGFTTCFLLTGALATGCGSTETTVTPPVDAGSDIVATKDAIVDSPKEANSCVADADLNTLAVPDASLADGASSVPVCLACVKSNCSSGITACNADCACNNAVVGFFGCMGAGGQLTSCAGGLIGLTGASQTVGLGLVVCVGQSCGPQCGVSLPGDGGGGTDASDAAADGG